jgi:serine/threonine protein kinase
VQSRNEGTEESSSAPPPPTKVVAPGPVVVDVKEQDVPVVEVKNLEVIPKEVANGTFYGKYSCTRELGSGSFSTIREAVCNETGRKFAVKIISRANISSEDEVSLEREVKILGELNHPNVVLLHEFHASRYFFHIVMELLGGGELFDRIVHEVRKIFYLALRQSAC